jgi:hypothetical protein
MSVPSSVVAIGANCFERDGTFAAISFLVQSRLEVIDPRAFCWTGITFISIPSSCQTIRELAFAHCKHLRTVEFPKKGALTRNDRGAFLGCPLQDIRIPKTVTFLGDGYFDVCSLAARDHAAAPLLAFRPGSPLTALPFHAFSGLNLTRFCVPETVTALGEYCCYQCSALQTATFVPACTIAVFSRFAFADITIWSIQIPSSVEIIGESCFRLCTELTEVTFASDSHLRILEPFAFSGSRLETILLPKSVEHICSNCFESYNRLSEVTFRNCINLQYIGSSTFAHTPIRNAVSLSSSVSFIGSGPFSFTEVTELAFQTPSALPCFEPQVLHHIRLEFISVPASVTSLGEECFSDCERISEWSLVRNRLWRLLRHEHSGIADCRKLTFHKVLTLSVKKVSPVVSFSSVLLLSQIHPSILLMLHHLRSHH